MKKAALALLAAVAVVVVSAQAPAAKKRVIRAYGGTNIGGVGLVIDASYDPRLDTLCPGYKVLNVAVINQSLEIIPLDPRRDEWSVKLVGETRETPVIHDLRASDPRAWAGLPEAARAKLSYPMMIPIGAREVIDLFVPASVDLERFTELNVLFKSLGARLEIAVRQ